MAFKIIFIVFLFLSIISIGCDPCLGEGWRCGEQFSFRLVDKQTRTDLVFGPNPLYKPDSVYLTVHLPGYLGDMSYIDTNRTFRSSLVLTVDTFFLRLSSSDMDTLLMSYRYKKVRCCNDKRGYGTITGIRFNGRNAVVINGIYLLEK